LVGRGKLRQEQDVPTTDSMLSFAVSSKEGGGLLSGLMSGGAGKALDGMKKFGIGLLAVGAALWVAAKAFQEFGEVECDAVE
jgi:hypothetical protein